MMLARHDAIALSFRRINATELESKVQVPYHFHGTMPPLAPESMDLAAARGSLTCRPFTISRETDEPTRRYRFHE
ncbi:hypothetical protein [Noviherbaspirillum galbum]|uniref:Uncharacterized protein n=1 Tax=Noviherbaspirillum galbum TaxID=2709383 RepID=A0A6B3SHL8_9BURK|nr:hypothetical protein [Noviherbaspirillum galbum]NEX60361.1 hypothetical protein [Noviherbaspirillum galbum]